MKESKRKSKIIEIVALFLSVLAFIIGIFAFGISSNIKDKTEVKPEGITGIGEEKPSIVFSADEDKKDTIVSGTTVNGAVAGSAKIITKEDETLANFDVRFTKPGQEVIYTFYSQNKGKVDAYLDTITYANVKGENFFKICSAVNPRTTNRYLVSSACESISMTVKAGDNVITNGSITDIKEHILKSGDKEKIVITIKYDKNGTQVDGDFVVRFGSVTLSYLSESELLNKGR